MDKRQQPLSTRALAFSSPDCWDDPLQDLRRDWNCAEGRWAQRLPALFFCFWRLSIAFVSLSLYVSLSPTTAHSSGQQRAGKQADGTIVALTGWSLLLCCPTGATTGWATQQPGGSVPGYYSKDCKDAIVMTLFTIVNATRFACPTKPQPCPHVSRLPSRPSRRRRAGLVGC